MAGLGPSFPLRLQQILSAGRPTSPALKLESDPPAKVKSFIDRVIKSPLHDIAIPLSGFRWEYNKGNFHHWRPLFMHFDTYFKTYISSRKDLLLSDCIIEEDGFPKQSILQILRVMQIILENCHNKGSFNGLEHFKLLLASTDPDIIIATLETLSSLMKINLSKLHGSGKLISCGSMNSHLLSLAQGWGSKEEGLGLYSCVLANERNQQEGFSLFPPDMENECDAIQCRLGSTLHFEFNAAAPQDSTTYQGKKSKLHVINIPGLHMRKEDDLVILKELIEKFSVPPEHRFSLLTRIRYARAFRSPRMCRLYSKICILAFIVLVQSNDAHDELVSFFANEPEYTNELIRLVRSEESIPATIRALAMLALGAQLAAYASSHERARIFSGSSIISVGGNRMVLLSVLQKAIASLSNPSDPSSPLFVDALLQFFLLHVLSSSSSSSVLRVSGMVPPLLPLLSDSDPSHINLVCAAVKTLQKLMEYSTTAVSVFKDNGGVDLLSEKLRIEVDKVIDTNEENSNAMVIGDASRFDEDYLYSQKRLVKLLLKALGSATYSQGNPTRSQNLNNSVSVSLSLIFRNVNKFGGDIYFSAVTVMSEIIHKDPSCFQMLDDAGLPEAFLASVVSGVLPASKALACLPTGLGAICLNNKGLEAVKESSALRFLVDTFTRRKYLVAMNEGVVLLANAVEELLRHVSSLRSTGVDIIIEIITKLASLGEGKCSESSSGESVNTAMETDSNDKTNEGHDLVSVMDQNADGISGEQFVQLCIFHVMVLVHRTMENSETCRLFVEKGGIDILLKLLLRPSITQSSEGMPIALHSTLVFKGFTQHHSVPLARAFCFSLREHLKRALGGFRSVAGSFLLAQQTTMDAESFASLFVVEFLLFLAASKDNRWISTLLTEFGDSNKDVLEDIGRLQREVLWQVALLQGSELEKEFESAEPSNDMQKTNASTNEFDDQRFSSFRQYLDPLLRRRVSGWSVESQFSDLISIYRDIGRVAGGSRRTGSESYFASRFSSNRQQSPGNASDLSVNGKTEDEKRRSYYSLCRDMMRSLSYHCNLLFMELGKAMLLASRRENNPAVLPSSVVSVATVVSSIMSDHLTFSGYVNPSESDVSISTKCRYLGKVVDFVDGVLTDRPESCNPIIVSCLYSCGVIQAILTTFEATSQLLFTLNGVAAPSSPMETDDASLRLDKDEADNSWIFGPLMSYCMLMDHLATSSFILSSSTKQLLDQPLVSGNVSFPPDAESFVKLLQSKVLKAILPIWTHSHFAEFNLEFVGAVVSIMKHVLSGVEVRNTSGTAARTAGPPPDESAIEMIVEMGFTRSRAEEALRQAGTNSVEIATDWLFTHPEEPQEDAELARALAMSLGSTDSTSKDVEVADANDLKHEEEEVQLPVVDDLLANSMRLLQVKESSAFAVRDLLLMICSQNDGQNRSKVLNFVIDHIKLCPGTSTRASSMTLSALFHVLSLILHEDVAAREIASKTGFVTVSLGLLLDWDRTLQDDHNFEVPKWVTACFLSIDRMLQFDSKLTAENIDLVQLKQNKSTQHPVSIDENRKNDCSSPLSLISGNLDRDNQKHLLEILCRCIKRQLKSETMHVVLQLCATLTKAHSIAVNFLEYGGLHALLSLPTSSLFSGFNTVATAIIRHILEDPHTLQQAMELEIRHSLVAATSRHSNARMTPRNFVQNLALVISRDPAVFIQAAQAVCQIEMVGDRPYVVLLKDRDKDKTKDKEKDKEKVAEKEKQFGTDSKTTIGDLTIGAASSCQGKVQDTNTKISKVHKRSAQSFTSVIEHLMDVIFSFIPSKVDDVVGTSLGTPSTEMDIDSSSAKGKGKAIALPKEDVKTTNEEVSTSLAKTVFVLKLLTEILLTYTSSMHIILRRDAELRSSRSSQKGLPFVGGGFFHHILHRFVPCPGTHKKDKKADGDWRQKLASRANQFLVASSIRSSEGRKRVFYEISNVFNEFVGTAVGCKAPNASMHCFVDLLNDILAARSPVGSNISSEASVTFIDVGLVQSLTKTLDVLDLDHSDSAKIVSGVVKALELVTREYVHSSGINSAKGNSSNLTSDQNQVDSNIGGDRFQSLENTLHPGHNEAAVEHMEPFGLAQTPRSSDDMDHEQDLDVSFARDTEDDFMHETSEEGGVLENGISTVEITFELPHNASEGLGDEDEDDDMSEDGDGDEVEEDEDEDEDEDQNNDLEEDDVQMLHPDTDHDDHEIEDEEFDEDVLEEEDEDDEGVILRLEEGVNGMNVFDHIEVLSGGNNFPGGALLLGRRQEFAASMSNRLGRANDHGVNTEHPLLVDPASFLVQRRQSENAVDLAFSDGRHDGSSSRLDAIFQTLRSGRHGHRFSMWLDDSQQRSSSNVVPEGIEELLLSQLRRPTPAEPSSHDGAESLQQKDEPDPLQNSENHAGEQVGVQGENNDNMLVSTPVSLPDAPRDSHDESSSGLIQERETSGTNEQMCEMQFEQNDAAVRDVEAVSQASSGSGATLGESLRSLEVEIGSVDGHDDGERQERQGPAERVPSGDLHQISRTRRSSGTVVPVSGRDASLESVSEVPAGPSQEANQNILLEENPVIRNADSDSIDPTFLEALPEELRAEVLSSRQNQVAQTSSDQSQAEGEIDPEFLAALPPDIREEVLAQQRAQRQSQPQELAGQPVEMDAVSIIATFPSEIREEVLLTSPDTLLATLTPALVAEANMLRERFAHRYHSNALLGLQRRSHRGDHSRRSDLIGSNTDRSAVASASRRSAAGKLIEAAGTPLVGTDALKALVRLLRVVQPLYKGQFQRLLLNLCAHQDTRTSLVQILMDMLMLDLRGSITTDTDVTDPPFRLYGCQSYIMYSRPQFSDGVPPLVSRRLLETLTFLARNHQYVAKILLHHEVSYIKGFEVGASNQGPGKAVRMEEDNPEDTIGKGDFSVVVLLRLLNQPLYMRSIAHLEQLLNLLEVIMIHAESDVDLQNKSLSSTEQQSVPEGVVQDIQVNNETQPVVQDTQPNAATPIGEGCSSMTQKNARAVLTGLPQAELRLLCSLLAREGLSDNAYVLAAEVLKRLVAVVPTFCHLFILELAKSMHNLVASGMNELHLNDGETERALLASSTTSGTAILRVLQALGSLVSVLHDKKDPQLISENEYSGALSQVSEVNSSLESLWLELSSCISKIESSSDSTGDVDIILGNLANVGSSSPLPAGSQNILPYIESFFVTCEKLHPGQLDVNQELVIATASDLEDASTSGQKLSGFSVKVDEKYGAFVKFSEKHRKLLNAFIRQNPGLLEKSFSLMLKVPRFIDFDNKRAHFRSKIKHQHDHHHSPVRISVRRAYILEDSYNQLRMRSPQDLKGRLTVHFQGEEGIDAGGLTREWYQLLSRVIFDKGALLFTTVGNESTFQPNPNSVYQTEHLSYFKFVGRVVGKALFDGQLLDVHFTRSFYKHILGVKVTYHDIEAIDPDYYKNLKWMLENDISDVLDLTFSVDADEEKLILYEKAEVTDHELIPGGRNIRVTEENKREYVDLVVEHRLTTAIRPQINAFLEGFNELTPRDLISIFNDRELELLISGLPDIDLDDLRANTEYSGYSNASPIIQWFWDVLQVFSKEDKARFLQFVTGTSKVPLEGFSALQGISGAQRFQIHKAYGSPNHLPSAHTCFNQLDLPEYPSKEQLHERLLLAIHEGSEGFGFG